MPKPMWRRLPVAELSVSDYSRPRLSQESVLVPATTTTVGEDQVAVSFPHESSAHHGSQGPKEPDAPEACVRLRLVDAEHLASCAVDPEDLANGHPDIHAVILHVPDVKGRALGEPPASFPKEEDQVVGIDVARLGRSNDGSELGNGRPLGWSPDPLGQLRLETRVVRDQPAALGLVELEHGVQQHVSIAHRLW